MILGLAGKARVGKDTVAEIISRQVKAIGISQADPMKWLARDAFGFSPDALWGPSERRGEAHNEPIDDVLYNASAWIGNIHFKTWAEKVLGDSVSPRRLFDLRNALLRWVPTLPRENLTARIVLQMLGTECGRAFDPTLWNSWTIRTCRQLLGGGYMYHSQHGLVTYSPSPVYDIAIIRDIRFRNEIVGVKSCGGKVVKLVDPIADGSTVGIPGHQSETEQDNIPAYWYDLVLENDKSKGLLNLERNVGEALRLLFPPPYTMR